MIQNTTTRRFADAVIDWLQNNPHGGAAMQIHSGINTGYSLSRTKALLQFMAKCGREPIVTIGEGAHRRYAAACHEQAARAHILSLIETRSDRWRKEVERRLKIKREAEEREEMSGFDLGEEMHQVVVNEWPEVRKEGPCSVFELASW